jgi:hypothetical protein
MASLGFIGMGISSVSGRGVGKHSGNNSLAALIAKKKKDTTKISNKNCKLTYEEVKFIRKLDEEGICRKQIFANHVEGKMRFDSMVSVLNYITRVWS